MIRNLNTLGNSTEFRYVETRGEGHFDVFGTGYVPLCRVSFSPFLLPSWVSFSAKMLPKGYKISKSLPSDRTTMVILLPDRVFRLRKMLPDRVKITAPQRTHPYNLGTPPPGRKMELFYSHLIITELIFEKMTPPFATITTLMRHLRSKSPLLNWRLNLLSRNESYFRAA